MKWYGMSIVCNESDIKLCDLSNLNESFYGNDLSHKIEHSDDFTINLKRVYVKKSYDKKLLATAYDKFKNKIEKKEKDNDNDLLKGTNDFLITSSHKADFTPIVERVHYMKHNDKQKKFNMFYNDCILSKSNYKNNSLKLTVQVADLDFVPTDDFDNLEEVINNSGLAFPQLSNFTPIAKQVVDTFMKLIEITRKHNVIMDGSLNLKVNDYGTYDDILQEGIYISVEDNVGEYDEITVNKNLFLERDGEEFKELNYFVIEIKKGSIDDEQYLIDQKVAKLVSELNGKGNGTKAPIFFLRETLTGYNNFNKISDYQSLSSLKSLSENQQRRLEKLREDPIVKKIFDL